MVTKENKILWCVLKRFYFLERRMGILECRDLISFGLNLGVNKNFSGVAISVAIPSYFKEWISRTDDMGFLKRLFYYRKEA